MAIKNWDTKTSRILYRRFEAGESLIEGLESLALSEGIREAAVIFVAEKTACQSMKGKQ